MPDYVCSDSFVMCERFPSIVFVDRICLSSSSSCARMHSQPMYVSSGFFETYERLRVRVGAVSG